MLIGYARVSTADQNLDLQLKELTEYGCEKIYQEKISGKSKERPELQLMLSHIRKGDKIIVWKLDRIGRSLKDLIEIIEGLNKKEVDFVSLHNQIDTSTPTGRFTFNLFAALAEYEREILVERTKAGLSAAKAQGRVGGRPGGYSKETMVKIKKVKALASNNTLSVKEIIKSEKISKATYYRYISYNSFDQPGT